jgi:hypothetical protein
MAHGPHGVLPIHPGEILQEEYLTSWASPSTVSSSPSGCLPDR